MLRDMHCIFRLAPEPRPPGTYGGDNHSIRDFAAGFVREYWCKILHRQIDTAIAGRQIDER